MYKKKVPSNCELQDEYVSLKEYFEARLTLTNDIIDAKLDAIMISTKLAAESLEKRLESMNEFRGAIVDQQKTFLSKSEYQIHHKTIEDDIRILRESRALLEGKASQSQLNITFIIAIGGLLIALINIIHIIWG